MRYCKLRKEDGGQIVSVVKEKFEAITKMKPPYYQPAKGSQKAQAYAVCVDCDNPVVLVGFYSKRDENTRSNTPHPRHTQRQLEGLPAYNQTAYDLCRYSKKREYDPHVKKTKLDDPLAQEIRRILVEHFDKVVYVMEKVTGFRYSEAWLEIILTNYLNMDGFNYVGASIENLPWVLLHLSLNQKLYGRRIAKDSLFYELVKTHYKRAIFEYSKGSQFEKLTFSGYCDAHFAFIGHQSEPKNGEIVEKVTLCLWDEDKLLIEMPLIFDTDYFFALLEYERWETSERGKQLKKLAYRLVNP